MQAGDGHSWCFHFLEIISGQIFQVEKTGATQDSEWGVADCSILLVLPIIIPQRGKFLIYVDMGLHLETGTAKEIFR